MYLIDRHITAGTCAMSEAADAELCEWGRVERFEDHDAVTIGSSADTQTCEWGRLDYVEGVEDQVVETGGYSAGAPVTVLAEDDVFFTFGCGTWTKQ